MLFWSSRSGYSYRGTNTPVWCEELVSATEMEVSNTAEKAVLPLSDAIRGAEYANDLTV